MIASIPSLHPIAHILAKEQIPSYVNQSHFPCYTAEKQSLQKMRTALKSLNLSPVPSEICVCETLISSFRCIVTNGPLRKKSTCCASQRFKLSKLLTLAKSYVQ
ncbi:hypothetical protein KIN20_038407 [Parelaphostrongylus tenuis]|uniref:Uncharacterized protein n=1 Tax=Parelaphostrongylus tenuis TaxID=148309 RepID=A0AAD5MJM0_PARTN|nr:hypothetical protein KIN20_038407 [Parelaphostrongylus tenuis]